MDETTQSKDPMESEAMDSGSLLLQMREKLKTQAQRIRSLESYKVLCEERLSELFPSHPLPILPEHIGSGGLSSSQELLSCRSKIAKLEQQISQSSDLAPSPGNTVTYNKLHELYTLLHQRYNSMLKEKTDLEESLRSEVLASEEQRAYIEVLKQAIEVKAESLGLAGVKAQEFAEFSQMRISTDESRRETSKLSTKIMDYEAQIKSLMESLKIRNVECRDLGSERDELTDQLHQAAEALQYAEEEVQKLEEEKSNLLDYVDNQNKTEQELRSENKELRNKVGGVVEENKKNGKNISGLSEENRKLKEELEGIRSEFNRNEKTLKETQQSFMNLKARVEEKDRSIQKYKEENNNISIQNSSLQAENITLSENLNKIEGEFKLNKSELDMTRVEEDKVKENLSQLRAYSQQIQEEKLKVEKRYLETDHSVQELDIQLKITRENCSNLEKKLHETASELESTKSLYKSLQEKEEIQSHTLSEQKKKNLHIQSELDSLLKMYQASQSELSLLKDSHDQAKLKIFSLNQENSALHSELLEVNSILNAEKSALQRSQDENIDLRQRIEEQNQTIEVSNESYLDRDAQFKTAEKEIEGMTQFLSKIQNELLEEKYSKTTQYEELCVARLENEKLKRENAGMREAQETACRPVRGFSSCLSPMNSARFKETTLGFTEDRGEYSLGKWIENAVKEIQELSGKCMENTQVIESIKHKNMLLTQDLERNSQDATNLKSKELMLKTQIENSSQENAYLRENMKSQINSLQQEIISLRNSMQSVYEENEKMENYNRGLNNEISLLKQKISSQEHSYFNLEKRFKLSASEKLHLETLLSNYKSGEHTFNNSYRSSS